MRSIYIAFIGRGWHCGLRRQELLARPPSIRSHESHGRATARGGQSLGRFNIKKQQGTKTNLLGNRCRDCGSDNRGCGCDSGPRGFQDQRSHVERQFDEVREVNFNYDSGRQELHLNATLELRISVRNPNRASFKFRNGTTLVYYTGKTVGVGVISAGKLPADSTGNLTSVVRIVADGLLSNSYLLSKALSGSLNFSTSTRISGRVNVLNIYKHHAVSNAFCNLTVAVSKQRIESQQCIYSIKL